MGIFDHLLHGPALGAFKNGDGKDGKEPPVPPATSIPVDMGGWPSETDFTGWVNGMYCREYAVRIVVDFIVRNIASLPFKVYRKDSHGDPQEIKDGALHGLMRRPSPLPGETRYRFIQHILQDMLLEDRWLCLLGMGPDGRYTLRRVPAEHYTYAANSWGEISSVTVDRPDKAKPDSFRLPDPRIVLDIGYIDGLHLGEPVTNVLRPLLAEQRMMADYRRNIGRHGAQIPAYVYRPKEMPWASQEDYDDFTNGMRNYSRHGGQEGFMPVFKDGMEIRTVDNLFKPVDMDDLEARENINIMVANAFQVSPENVGFRTGTNANIAAYKEKLWNVELLPYITAFEDALNSTLPEAVNEPDCYVKANLDAKLRGTMETQYQALSTATGRPFMTTNYARALLDMPRVDGGDELITPLNVTLGGQPSPQDGGTTQNAQQGASPNGKTAEALAIFDQFQQLHQCEPNFRSAWDAMRGESDET